MNGGAGRLDAIIERALQGEATEAELAELAVWRNASPENERHCRRTERIIAAARSLRPRGSVPPRPTAGAIIAAVESRHSTRRDRLRAPARWIPWSIAAAAVLVAAIALGGNGDVPWAPAEVVTGASELATVKLGDGTVVRLAPSSRLRVEADRPREVTLEGRAFFAVTTTPGRPFRVATNGATVKVLGTRFELATDGGGVRLRVVEGRVELDTPVNTVEVSAGEESGVRNGAATPPTPLTAADVALDWVGEFLVFQSTPLRDAAADIERLYGVRVLVGDSTLSDATVTAAFTDQPVKEVVDVVCVVLNAACTWDRDVVTIRR
jgi:transmembrane sensor